MHTCKLTLIFILSIFFCGSIAAGEIEVIKQVIGGNDSTFEIVIDGNPSIPITDGVSTGFVSVTNGSNVTISESGNGLPQFTNISYQCVDGFGNLIDSGEAFRNSSSLASFSITVPNSNIALENRLSCTLFNIKKATLLISKTTTNGDNTVLFDYVVDANGSISSTSLTGGSSTEVILGKKFNGNVVITETLPLNWSLQSSSCVNLDGNPITTSGSNPITVTLAQGDNVLCSFINAPDPGVIVIDKQTNPTGDSTPFSFTSDYSADFSLSDADAPNISGALPPGIYSVSETVPTGWVQANASCDDGSPVNAIDVASGETVTCTFVNNRNPTLTLTKTVINDNAGIAQATDFIPSIDGNPTTWDVPVSLTVGTHIASESNLPTYLAGNWGGDCAIDGSITLVIGQVANCTITNDDIEVVADLSVTKNDTGTTYTPGETFSYTITINNGGPDSADGAVFTDPLAAWAENVAWVCAASGGAVCPADNGTGSLNETILVFPDGGQLIYTINGNYSTNMANY